MEGRIAVPGADLTFDQYSDAIRDTADVLYLLTEPSMLGWGVKWRPIGHISIQIGVEGGSKILHGISRSDTVLFVLQTTNYADGVFFHGCHAKPQDVAIIAPDRHFTIVTTVRVGWAAIAIPVHLLADLQTKHSNLTSEHSLLRLDAKGINELITAIRCTPVSELNTTEVTAADLQILKTLTALLGVEHSRRLVPDKASHPSEKLLHSALEFVRMRPKAKITIEDLARELRVNERTLLRVFKQHLKIGVKQYLLVRQLNLVRRAIRENCTSVAQVTTTMTDYGVTEFGRFAARYKELFGETPSETLKNFRPSRSREILQHLRDSQ